jgi:hypothetical protein
VIEFGDLGSFVDYFYQMMPKLQGHLTAMQEKLVHMDVALAAKIDRGFVERMFERFQGTVGELKNGFDNLRHALAQTATRNEINNIIDDLFGSLSTVSETSIGRVRCMACGREMTKVAGALTEAEIARALGIPPNSIACHTPTSPGIGIAYQSREGFNSSIVESPRALRPFRPLHIRPKLKPNHSCI